MSTPFFDYAKARGVPYGQVLCFADAYDRRFQNLSCWEVEAMHKLPSDARQDVIALCKVERQRRAMAARMSPTIILADDGVTVLPPGICHHGENSCSEQANACEQEEGA